MAIAVGSTSSKIWGTRFSLLEVILARTRTSFRSEKPRNLIGCTIPRLGFISRSISREGISQHHSSTTATTTATSTAVQSHTIWSIAYRAGTFSILNHGWSWSPMRQRQHDAPTGSRFSATGYCRTYCHGSSDNRQSPKVLIHLSDSCTRRFLEKQQPRPAPRCSASASLSSARVRPDFPTHRSLPKWQCDAMFQQLQLLVAMTRRVLWPCLGKVQSTSRNTGTAEHMKGTCRNLNAIKTYSATIVLKYHHVIVVPSLGTPPRPSELP